MGAVFADIVAVYVYKSLVRLIRFIESIGWHKATASLLSCELVIRGTGCPFVKVAYQINPSENATIEQEEVPFYLYWFAKRYVEKCASRHAVRIRVHPTYPVVTRFFEFDQK